MSRTPINTLEYDEDLCNRCGMCAIVCPHRVFALGEKKARLVDEDSCMECGACELNCSGGAIKVDSDVGCASAMMMAALKGKGSKQAPCCG
jgi:NAD-dependent dihydropyrimidine dehydrogenase PreA subunit